MMTYKVNAGRTKAVRNALGNVTTLNYDLNGRQVSVMDPLGRVSTQVYDNAGQSVANISPSGIISTMVYDGAGRNTASIDPANNRWTTVYDATGKQLASVTPLNLRTSYTYDNASRMVGVTNPKNLVSTTVYDEANQTIASVNPLGDRTTYTYDNDGRRTEIINPANGRITMVYDSRGSMTAIANELNQRTTYTYNPVGTVATRRFANGDVTTYTYDANQQLVTAVNASGTSSYFYDAVGSVVGNSTTNAPAQVDLISESFVFDAVQQPTDKNVFIGQNSVTHFFTYDAAGQRTTIKYPTETITTYAYDSDGRIQSLQGTNNAVATMAYDSRGFRTTLTYASGRTQVYAFDSDGRNTSINDKRSGTNYVVQTYTYDANGNRTNVLDVNGSNSTYTYDSKDRLTLDATSGTNAHTYTYTYDSRDNITLSTETGTRVTMSYDVASRLTTSISGTAVTTYTYDTNGNMTNANAAGVLTTMLYDSENRLKSHNGSEIYYNTSGQKTYWMGGGDFNSTYWDGDNYLSEWLYEEASNDPITRVYNLVDSIMLGETNIFGDEVQYAVDFLGSVLGRIDAISGTLTSGVRFRPYGSKLSGKTPNPGAFAWTGNTGSRVTGFGFSEQYNRARHYSSTTSQWTSRDPLWPEEPAYGYVEGNPALLNDPYGFKPQKGDPCEKFYHTGPPQIGPPNTLDTPCGKLIFPPNLKVPPKTGDLDAWKCFESIVSKKLNVNRCVEGMIGYLVILQKWYPQLTADGFHEADKIIHCVVGCAASEIASPCCAFYLGIWMETTTWKGKPEPVKQDFYATWAGISCQPDKNWTCAGPFGAPSPKQLIGECLMCCVKKHATGGLPFESPPPS